MGVFLSVVGDDLERPGIENLRDSIGEQHKNYEDFVLFHIPFALDVTDNPFWIDIQTGEIKYTDYEECIDPYKDAITVASSFKNFCKRIKNRDMSY
jgi:tetrahydromethanopterin S-methyltransferase subunit H